MITRIASVTSVLVSLSALTFSVCLHGANLPPVVIEPFPSLELDRAGDLVELDLLSHLHDPDVPGTAVRIPIRLGDTVKQIDLALFDEMTPLTVANFLAYIGSGAFAANFIHRSVPGFILQGGGFRFVDTNTYATVPTFAPVPNEPGISNLRGTVAMAKLGGDPNSATSQWFINLNDNSANLDEQNGGFTVFGRVLGTGMTVADEVATLPRYNASGFHSAWTDLPLKDFEDPLSRFHFVETDAEVIPSMEFTAASADPELIEAVLSETTLTLIPGTERVGKTTITVTATDLDGGQISVEFEVELLDHYAAWRADIPFADEGASASAADPDADGWPNLLEFAFDGNPLIPAIPSHGPRMEAGGGIILGHRLHARLRYTAWMSDDLQTWSPVWTTSEGFAHAAVHSRAREGNFEILTIRRPASSLQPIHGFWRVSVEITD